MELETLRTQINDIDKQIFGLFSQRMRIIDEIALLKKEKGFKLFQPERERELIKRLSETAPEVYSHYAVSLYKYIMELSKGRQREVISKSEKGSISALVSNAKTELLSPRVVYQGVDGSFAKVASQRLYPSGSIINVETWDDVMNTVESGSCDYGVIPIENSTAGSVIPVYDLLIKHHCHIVKAIVLPITHCLLGIRGAKISDIRTVYSHIYAFPQCEEFLKKHRRMRPIPCQNTAVAAEKVALEGKRDIAAIASRECAHLYGLDILAESIQQSGNNMTRFVSVSNRIEIPGNANKTSIIFSLPHVTGSLYRVLSRFANHGLNLTKIESRPFHEKNFEYVFYVDFLGSVHVQTVLNLLDSLAEELPDFNFLGNFYEQSL